MKYFTQKINIFFLLLIGLFAFSYGVSAQVNCTVTIDTPPPVCRFADFQLSVPQQENCTYKWQKQNEPAVLGTENSLIINIDDTTVFVVTVKDTLTQEECVSEPFVVETFPPINVEFNQVQLTCTNGDNDNGNTAQVKAMATGAFLPSEYHYFWHVHPLQIAPNDSSLAIGLKANLNYVIDVKDNYGCYITDTFKTKAYYNADIEIDADPDTAYIERPHVTFSFENLSADSITITNYFWNFGDDSPTSDLEIPVHTYEEEGEYYVVLTAYNQQGCDTTYVKSVSIQPIKLFIPNVFTPNTGDNINNYFVIRVDEGTSGGDDPPGGGAFKSFEEANPNNKPLNFYYESTDLVIYNRYGNKVFESTDYQNDWDGDNLSDGTYFYILKCHGYKNDYTFKGSVMIFRGGE
jgi:PKD repeat protein